MGQGSSKTELQQQGSDPPPYTTVDTNSGGNENCNNCVRCKSCVNCSNCVDCTSCTNCSNVESSIGCRNCSNSYNLVGCENCSNCRNLKGRKNCSNEDGGEESKGL